MFLKLSRGTVLGAVLLSTALVACKKSSNEDPTKIERYSGSEVPMSGVTYLGESTAARTAAEPQATPVAIVPVNKPLTRVAEKGGFVLVEWAEESGARRQGWLSTTTAKLSPTPVAEAPAGEIVDPRRAAPATPVGQPRPAAPAPVETSEVNKPATPTTAAPAAGDMPPSATATATATATGAPAGPAPTQPTAAEPAPQPTAPPPTAPAQ